MDVPGIGTNEGPAGSGCRNSSMGTGCGASSTTNPADDALRRDRRTKQRTTKMAIEIAAIPPMTPPAMAPAFELLLLVWEGEAEEVEVEVGPDE